MTLDITLEILTTFPKVSQDIGTPPIKCQGIKTRLVNFIFSNIKWDGKGKWVEPFLGSGVVLFNAMPKRALATDTNKHIIEFYNSLQSHRITSRMVRDYLEEQDKLLRQGDGQFYYDVRKRFNSKGDSLDFIFLSRACFNGVMRFNSKGEFNVPYNHKSTRFSKSYITKIVNQVDWVASVIEGRDWSFETCDYEKSLSRCNPEDFVYADPPYPARINDFYNRWTEEDAKELTLTLKRLPCGFALSLWKENIFRKNAMIDIDWKDYPIKTFKHFYHVGSTEDLRHEMQEALIIKKGFVSS